MYERKGINEKGDETNTGTKRKKKVWKVRKEEKTMYEDERKEDKREDGKRGEYA